MHHATFAETERPTEPELTVAALLSEIATTLLRLPFDDGTRDLHLRALRLRRRVDPLVRPDAIEGDRRALRESVLALRTDTAHWLATRAADRRSAADAR